MRGERLTAMQKSLLRQAAENANGTMHLYADERARGRSLIKRGLMAVPGADDGSPPQFVQITPAGRRALEEADHD